MMKDYKWLFNRARAMSAREIGWRIKQIIIKKKEKESIYSLNKPVTKVSISSELQFLHINIERLFVNWDNENWSTFNDLRLFGTYKYSDYSNKWNAGFQTNNQWPEEEYSADIKISQRTDIGDIRTNWELNRHFQFAALAKSYYCTHEERFFSELKFLFLNWNDRNLFLHGVEWTSPMEIAIRVNSWVYTYVFLKKSGCQDEIIGQLEHGILVMTNYIFKHHSRYSSANNHLIIEMYAVAIVGIITNYKPWIKKSLKTLTDELVKQNYVDGINKEMSTHYQAFVMEAYGLLCITMQKNQITIPNIWYRYLSKMSEYIADSTDDYKNTMEFGDNDEGKILDLKGDIDNYYQYVLNLMGYVLDCTYTNSLWHENLEWITPSKRIENQNNYTPKSVCARKIGGYTMLRSSNRKILIGIDHGRLGYKSIAAHGHADALSFQIIIDGKLVFVDSGTYNYHFTSDDRNYYRKTEAHNTVLINQKEQSEILGPFMWGKKARTFMINLSVQEDIVTMRLITICGFRWHYRTFRFNGSNELIVSDRINKRFGEALLHISPLYKVCQNNNIFEVKFINHLITIQMNAKVSYLEKCMYSDRYNHQTQANCIRMKFEKELTTRIIIH